MTSYSGCGPLVAGRAHAAKPHSDAAPRPEGAALTPIGENKEW
ncbi:MULTISPECIES: hypothetical protein [Streptomyces]|uniref:Uncharacterized protein n=2 Tax=Streptomyces TaxID=1883 RepID=A0ABV9J2W0_9ACTN